MDIISVKFAGLAIVSAIIYYVLKPKLRIVYLALLSGGFIASFHYTLLIYVLTYSYINYFIGLQLPGAKNKVLLYRIGIAINLSQLILLKYASFAIDPFFHLLNSDIQVSKISEIFIPLGISYFTLQGIGYLINIKMGWEKPEQKFQDFFVYISFFPKFLSGPIERSNHFLPQLKKHTSFSEDDVSSGLRTVLTGFFKKVVIANQLAPYVMDTFADINSVSGYSLWIILFLLPIYLYFDFSGYTDIAIGFARTFGIELLPNFKRPFFSENVTTFWRRFHMSLSLWFNDYIFKQVSFRRRRWGVITASMYAVFFTWLLFGIWHGAGWTFMLLGVLQAIAIYYEFFTKKWRVRMFSKVPNTLRIWLGRISTYLFYCVSLVFFFAPNLSSVFSFLSGLFDIRGPLPLDSLSLLPIFLLIYIPVFLIIELIQNDYSNFSNRIESFWASDNWKAVFLRWTVYSIMITIMFVNGLKDQQFVYANF